MSLSPYAGKPAPSELIENIPSLVSSYYTVYPDIDNPTHQIAFGTSGHRGSSLKNNFNEAHILAVAQSICDYRKSVGVTGPVYIGKDTHALSEPAFRTVIEVLVANDVQLLIQERGGYTPTPVISHAIINYNLNRKDHLADGIIITPSHNPPADGGIKYNPPHGGPADTDITSVLEKRANEILKNSLKDVKRKAFNLAILDSKTKQVDLIWPYVKDLESVVDMKIIKDSKVKIGVDPMGGAGVDFWEPIAEHYQLNLELVNKIVDPTFSFMCVDKDGKIRMDCSSPYAMASLIELGKKYDIAFGNDADYDRHGIVAGSKGLMNPNHYLAVAIQYLFTNRPGWSNDIKVGKTLVSSSMIDRVVADIGKELVEVPVGFKWFVDGLSNGTCGFGGEESAGASFLRMDGKSWSTDKDGIILDLLAAEITAKTGENPQEHYEKLTKKFGAPVYERADAPATLEQKNILKNLSPQNVSATELAGEKIQSVLTNAPGNNAAIGGLKVVTENAWFAARPSGTEDIYKIYAESFKGKDHLSKVQEEAQTLVNDALNS